MPEDDFSMLLDRALLVDTPVAPTEAFVAGVMTRVRCEHALRSGIPFPWARAAVALLAILGLHVALGLAATILRAAPP
jgi:hypothetical protein